MSPIILLSTGDCDTSRFRYLKKKNKKQKSFWKSGDTCDQLNSLCVKWIIQLEYLWLLELLLFVSFHDLRAKF